MIFPGHIRALVVDDNGFARTICSLGLGKLGIDDVEEAESGAEALLKLLEAPYDLVLLDWYMPDMTGAGVMQVLRDPRFGAAAQTPVILITAYPSKENLARARTLGVNEILPKPFTTEQLGMVVGRVLASKNTVDDAFFL